MREICAGFSYQGYPIELIEHKGATADEEYVSTVSWYWEQVDKVILSYSYLFGVPALIFLTYVIYHVISKIRGNEKNPMMNNFGIFMALLPLAYYSVNFTDTGTYTVIQSKYFSWYRNHETRYWWIYWFLNSAHLLYHWFFNWRYVKSTFRLPVLKKSAEFFNEMLERILKQREDQHVLFTAQELEGHTTEMVELKIVQRRQERRSNVIERFVLLLVVASSYPYVYVSPDKVESFFQVPMFLLLNGVMLYSVLKMRFAIKTMPNLFPDENLVAVHVLLFTVVTGLWIVERVFYYLVNKATKTSYKDPSYENYLNRVLASTDFL